MSFLKQGFRQRACRPTTHCGPLREPAVKPIKLLMVEDNEDGTVGGSHICLRNLVTHLDPSSIRPIVLFYQENRVAAELRAHGIPVHIWETQRRDERQPGPGAFRRVIQALRQVRAILRRIHFLVRHRIDVVTMNNSPGVGFDDWLPAAKLTGTRAVSHVRIHFDEPRRPLWRRLQRSFDHYITISATMQGLLRERGYPMDQAAIIFDTIDEKDLVGRLRREPREVREELGVPGGCMLVVMVGHLRRWKGQDAVLRSLALLPPAIRDQIVVAFAGGVGSNETYRLELLELIRVHGLERSVRLLGERKDVPDLMRASDVVLHASTLPEPFGLVVLEGMLMGRPVVASRSGGPLEIITPGTGLLFDPSIPDELASILTRLLAEPESREQIGTNGKERAQYFGTVEQTARQVEALYRTL